MTSETINISIPVEMIQEGETVFISTTEEAEKILGFSSYGDGKTKEEAEKQFWSMIRFMNEYYKERSDKLDCWKPFQKGDWKHIGGTWFIIFGIHVYFRTGKGMKGGRYIPFTNLNIMINNHWRKRKK